MKILSHKNSIEFSQGLNHYEKENDKDKEKDKEKEKVKDISNKNYKFKTSTMRSSGRNMEINNNIPKNSEGNLKLNNNIINDNKFNNINELNSLIEKNEDKKNNVKIMKFKSNFVRIFEIREEDKLEKISKDFKVYKGN
jgi:hypothetical protein